MRLRSFDDVHPDWEVVSALTPKETRATMELLITAMILDRRITSEERETLIDEFSRLPNHDYSTSRESVRETVRECEGRMRSMDAEDFGEYLDRVCGEIEGDEKRLAVLRLVTMLAVSDGFSEDEFDLCRAIGFRFGFDEMTVEHILRSTWESREAALAEADPTIRRKVRPVTGAHYYEDRDDSYGHPKPFSQEEITGEHSR